MVDFGASDYPTIEEHRENVTKLVHAVAVEMLEVMTSTDREKVLRMTDIVGKSISKYTDMSVNTINVQQGSAYMLLAALHLAICTVALKNIGEIKTDEKD